jgi:hypothetical protein
MPLPDMLANLGIPDECLDQRASASESGRSFVINKQRGDVIQRIKVDDCWLDHADGKKVDYMFWCHNSKQRLCLVELKGSNFGRSLEQIKATLHLLFERQPRLRDFADQGGVCAYVVLSKGVPQRLKERAKIKKLYNVIVYPHTKRLELEDVNDLCKQQPKRRLQSLVKRLMAV